MTEYPKRDGVKYLFDKCSCGHHRHDHELGFGSLQDLLRLRFWHHECKECQCPEYQYKESELYYHSGITEFVVEPDKAKSRLAAEDSSRIIEIIRMAPFLLGIGLALDI